MNRHHRRWSGLAVLILLMAWGLLLAAPAPGQEKKEFNVKSLPKVLKDGADSLEKDIPAGKADTEALQQSVKQAEKDLQDLGNQIATLKASQAAGELQIKQAQDALDGFSQREGQVAAQIKDLQDKREQLSKQASARVTAFAGLKQEVERLKGVKNSLWKSPEIQKAWGRYQQLAKQYRTAATQTLDSYDAVLKVLGEEDQALNGVVGELKSFVEVSRKEELLKRQSAGTLWGTVKLTLKSLMEMPGKLAKTLADPLLSHNVAASLRARWAPLLGLLVLFGILAWSVFQVRRLALPKLAHWQAGESDLGARVIFKAAEIVVRSLFILGFAAWLALTEWVLGWWQLQVARILLLGILVWAGLRLGLKLIQALFAGWESGGILPPGLRHRPLLPPPLQAAVKLHPGCGGLGLNLLQRLGLEDDSYQILEQAFGVVLLIWVLALLRSRHFDSLRAALPGPEWVRKKSLFLTLKLLLLSVLSAIIITSLLGFQNLSAYIAQAASLTGLFLVLFWVIWQVVKAVLEHVVPPPKSRGAPDLRRQEAVLRKNYLAIVKVVIFFLVAGVFLSVVNLWGVDQTFLVWLSQGLSWGTTLGPLRLTLLNLMLAALALYLGRWFSRFLQVFLEVRFSQRDDWDDSLRYTIANSLHYAILAVALVMALGSLGISFGRPGHRGRRPGGGHRFWPAKHCEQLYQRPDHFV